MSLFRDTIGLLSASGLCKSANGTFDVEMMGLIGAGNNPMVGMTVAVAVAIEEASK